MCPGLYGRFTAEVLLLLRESAVVVLTDFVDVFIFYELTLKGASDNFVKVTDFFPIIRIAPITKANELKPPALCQDWKGWVSHAHLVVVYVPDEKSARLRAELEELVRLHGAGKLRARRLAQLVRLAFRVAHVLLQGRARFASSLGVLNPNSVCALW